MRWYVYYYNINKNKIELFNIFDHYSFLEYAKRAIKKFRNKEEFAGQLKKELMYYFWSKSEYELIIETTEDDRIFLIPWCGFREPEKVKIEIKPIVAEDGFDWKEFANLHINEQRYKNKAKIDIYDQVMFEWDKFVDYCWDNKKKLLRYE